MKIMRIWVVAVLWSVASILGASSAWANTGSKVAVLDLQAVVLNSEAGKRGMAELEGNAEYKALIVKLENLEAELKALDEQAKSQGLTWGEDKKKAHVEKMNALAQERNQALNMLNRGRESVFMQLLNLMEQGIGIALEGVMASESIEIVLDSKAVVHKAAHADITAKVVARLDQLNAKAAEGARKAKP